MTMRNRYASHINFEEFDGMLGKAVPSNLDMVLERNSKFLVGEWKRNNEKVSIGQQILLKALARQPAFTVLVINGETDEGMTVNKFWKLNKYGKFQFVGDSVYQLKDYITEWYLWANDC